MHMFAQVIATKKYRSNHCGFYLPMQPDKFADDEDDFWSKQMALCRILGIVACSHSAHSNVDFIEFASIQILIAYRSIDLFHLNRHTNEESQWPHAKALNEFRNSINMEWQCRSNEKQWQQKPNGIRSMTSAEVFVHIEVMTVLLWSKECHNLEVGWRRGSISTPDVSTEFHES